MTSSLRLSLKVQTRLVVSLTEMQSWSVFQLAHAPAKGLTLQVMKQLLSNVIIYEL